MAKSPGLSVALVFDDSLDSSDGVAQYVKTVGAWLSRRGHKVTYLAGETKMAEWSGGKIYSLSKNQTVKFNGNKLSIPLPGKGRVIKQVLREQNFDVLHVMVPYSPFMAAKVIKYAPKSTAVVGTFHIFPSGTASKFGSRLLYLVLRPSLKRFKQIVSVSRAAADFAKSYYKISSDVVPNPVEVGRFKTKNITPSPDEIIFLGRLVKRKGAAQLIEAFSLLAGRNHKAKLVIAGDGPQRPKLEARVRRLKLTNRVRFLGYIDEADKPKILAQAAVACYPSLYGEAFGIVLIEAMAAGTPVVLAGDNPGYRSVLGAMPQLLFNPSDKQDLANQLDEFLTDQTKRQTINSWQKTAVKQYDIEIVGRQLVEIYSSAIARLDKNRHNEAHE